MKTLPVEAHPFHADGRTNIQTSSANSEAKQIENHEQEHFNSHHFLFIPA
jgi:hypothetical protein